MLGKKDMDDFDKSGDLNTIIGKGSVVEGTVKVQSSLRVDGRIKGQVSTTDSLVIGKEGSNVRDADWLEYIHSVLDEMDRFSARGFAFNCLSTYSDADRRRGDLYYADPRDLFDRCMTRYARNVRLLHDYGLYEFTLLIRKSGEARL